MIVVPEARFSLTGFGADAAQAVHLQVGVGDGHRSKTAAPGNPAHSVRPAKQMHLQIPDAPDLEYVSFCISLGKALRKFPGASRRVLYRIPFIFVQEGISEYSPALRAGFSVGFPLYVSAPKRPFKCFLTLRAGICRGFPMYFTTNVPQGFLANITGTVQAPHLFLRHGPARPVTKRGRPSQWLCPRNVSCPAPPPQKGDEILNASSVFMWDIIRRP